MPELCLVPPLIWSFGSGKKTADCTKFVHGNNSSNF